MELREVFLASIHPDVVGKQQQQQKSSSPPQIHFSVPINQSDDCPLIHESYTMQVLDTLNGFTDRMDDPLDLKHSLDAPIESFPLSEIESHMRLLNADINDTEVIIFIIIYLIYIYKTSIILYTSLMNFCGRKDP